MQARQRVQLTGPNRSNSLVHAQPQARAARRVGHRPTAPSHRGIVERTPAWRAFSCTPRPPPAIRHEHARSWRSAGPRAAGPRAGGPIADERWQKEAARPPGRSSSSALSSAVDPPRPPSVLRNHARRGSPEERTRSRPHARALRVRLGPGNATNPSAAGSLGLAGRPSAATGAPAPPPARAPRPVLRPSLTSDLRPPNRTARPTWWPQRGGTTRPHSELGRETPQRPGYCPSMGGRAGRRQVWQAVP